MAFKFVDNAPTHCAMLLGKKKSGKEKIYKIILHFIVYYGDVLGIPP